MTTSKGKARDSVAVEVHGSATDPALDPTDYDQSDQPDAKGPDPEQWDDPDGRDEPDYVDDEIKGPDPAIWGP